MLGLKARRADRLGERSAGRVSSKATVMQQRAFPATQTLRAGLLAGLAGAILIAGYFLSVMAGTKAGDAAGFFRFVASAAIGPGAYSAPSGVVLGVVLHVLVSLGWALGYAYVAARTPQVRTHPLVSGIAFGFVVMIAMQIVEVAANVYRLPTTFSLLNDFVAHIAFFGLPIAYIARRLDDAWTAAGA